MPRAGLVATSGFSALYFWSQFSRAAATWLQSWYRNLGSFCIILTQIPSSSPGQSGRSLRISSGMEFWCFTMRLGMLPSGNGGCPVSRKYIVQPNP